MSEQLFATGQGSAWALALAWLIDATLGEPPNRVHPVVWIGQAARPLLALRGRALHPALELAAGLVWTTLVAASAAAAVYWALYVLAPWPLLGLLVHALLLSTLFAARGLKQAGQRLADALHDQDLTRARRCLRDLCSRDPSTLNSSELAAGGIESLAENTHDSVVAPLCFYLLLGLPGVAFYRVLNTFDAMIGYRDDREWLGKAAARLDDVANLLPARVSALLLAAAARSFGRPWPTGVREQAQRTESPNAGWPMAVASATLIVRLEKPGHYVLGAAHPAPTAGDLRLAVRIVDRACLLGVVLAAVALALSGGPFAFC